MDVEIPQFIVFKETSKKKKGLRVFNIDQKVILQLASLRKNSNKDFDISSAPKVFIPIINETVFRFYILLKDKKSSFYFYCEDKMQFSQCVEHINNILQKYHKNRDSQDSVYEYLSRISNFEEKKPPKAIKHSSSEASIYITMNCNYKQNCTESDQTDNVACIMKKNIPIKPRRMSIFYNEIAQRLDYMVPNFNSIEDPLSGVSSDLKEIDDVKVPKNMDVHIYNVLTLRQDIQSPGGVELHIPKDNIMDIEVEEAENAVWISQIKNDHNLLRSLHVGDKICLVNDVVIYKKVQYIQVCKTKDVTFVIQRLPKAKVFAITNDKLKTSYQKTSNKDIIFHCIERTSDKNQKDPWILTEINFTSKVDSKSISDITETNPPYHTIILHRTSFLKSIHYSQ